MEQDMKIIKNYIMSQNNIASSSRDPSEKISNETELDALVEKLKEPNEMANLVSSKK